MPRGSRAGGGACRPVGPRVFIACVPVLSLLPGPSGSPWPPLLSVPARVQTASGDGLICPKDVFASTALAQQCRHNFFPLPAEPPFLAKQESSSCAVGPQGVAPAVASGLSIAIEAARTQGRWPETAKRRKIMATIGTFKKTGTEYTGEIFTLSLQAKGVRLVPTSGASGENAPTHRVLVGRGPRSAPPGRRPRTRAANTWA